MHQCVHASFRRILRDVASGCIHNHKRSHIGFKMAVCKNCGKSFKQARPWQKFCPETETKKCRKEYHRSYPNIEKRVTNLEDRVGELEEKIK